MRLSLAGSKRPLTLNKNAMMQQTYIQLLSTYLEQMRLAIQG